MLHLNQDQDIDSRGEQGGSDEGFYLNDLADGTALEIQTQHRNYRLIKRADTRVRISGHPTFCPEPVEVDIKGSFGSGPALKSHPGFIGRGMHLIFKHPLLGWITTSRILEVHKLG